MIVAADASAAVEIALNNPDADKFKRVLIDCDLVIAPDLFASEITNVFWKYGFFSDVPGEKCQKGIDYCLDLVDDLIPTKALCREVYSESMRIEHSPYDVFYLIVARRNNASVLTKDKKLKKAAASLGVKIVEL